MDTAGEGVEFRLGEITCRQVQEHPQRDSIALVTGQVQEIEAGFAKHLWESLVVTSRGIFYQPKDERMRDAVLEVIGRSRLVDSYTETAKCVSPEMAERLRSMWNAREHELLNAMHDTTDKNLIQQAADRLQDMARRGG